MVSHDNFFHSNNIDICTDWHDNGFESQLYYLRLLSILSTFGENGNEREFHHLKKARNKLFWQYCYVQDILPC